MGTYLGPFFSAYGIRTWDCWLSTESIVAFRHGLGRMLRLNSWQYLGFPSDPDDQPRFQHGRDRVYQITELQAIVVRRKRLSHNEVLLTLPNNVCHLYGIFNQLRTDEYRGKLFNLYPSLYRDEGFDSAPIPTGV